MKKILILLIGCIFLPTCSQNGKERKVAPSEGLPKSKIDIKRESLHSYKKPGKWKNYKYDHTPMIKKTIKTNQLTQKKYYEILVSIAFTTKKTHYVEKIFLTNFRIKELQSQSFKRDEIPETIFNLPANAKGLYYIVIKCNLHDMWQTSMVLDSKTIL